MNYYELLLENYCNSLLVLVELLIICEKCLAEQNTT